MPDDIELTVEEWRYISILIAEDVRTDFTAGVKGVADKHYETWKKIQAVCHWGHDDAD